MSVGDVTPSDTGQPDHLLDPEQAVEFCLHIVSGPAGVAVSYARALELIRPYPTSHRRLVGPLKEFPVAEDGDVADECEALGERDELLSLS